MNGTSALHLLAIHTLDSLGTDVPRMKVSGEQLEDRIVEVHWDAVVEGWRMMRFRDDKPAGNHIKTVESVIESIRDGVEKETVSITMRSRNGQFF